MKDKETQAFQKEVFQQFIDISKKFRLPLIIHSRKAEEDCIDIVSQNEVDRVYFHCFDGDENQTWKIFLIPPKYFKRDWLNQKAAIRYGNSRKEKITH